MGYCCVPSCKSYKSKGISFHKFPTSIESKRLWIIAISQQGNPRGCHWTPKGRSTVCSKHFTDSDFSISTTKKILLPNAVPSVFEDLVGRKRARRTKFVKHEEDASQLDVVKKELPEPITDSSSEETSIKEADHHREGIKIAKSNSVLPDMKNHSELYSCQDCKPHVAKIRKYIRGRPRSLVEKNLPESKTPTAKIATPAAPSVTVSAVEPSKSTEMLVEDISDCASLPASEDLSDTDCDESESSIEFAPRSTTIKISKNLQLVLRKLVTTIENQRSEILKLKKERDLLTQNLLHLRKKQIQNLKKEEC